MAQHRKISHTASSEVSEDHDTRPCLKRQRVADCDCSGDLEPLWRLSTVRGIDKKFNEGCVTFADLMSGSWKSSTLFNYTWDFEWMVSECPRLLGGHPVTLVVGDNPSAHAMVENASNFEHIAIQTLYLPPYGTHHTKMIILEFETGVRVVVVTANFEECDWDQKSQGIWWQEFPLGAFSSSHQTIGNCDFGPVLIDYIRRSASLLNYKKDPNSTSKIRSLPIQPLKSLADWLENSVDFSSATVWLVPSLPGRGKNWTHNGASRDLFGLMRMRSLLKFEPLPSIFNQKDHKSAVLCQCSSLGSLSVPWLTNFMQSLIPGMKLLKDEEIQIVWPTVASVRDSLEGWPAGASIPAPASNLLEAFQSNKKGKKSISTNVEKYQPTVALRSSIAPYLCKWAGESNYGREHAMPHIKTYFRYLSTLQKDSKSIAGITWFLLTSSNLSTSAWGILQKDGALSIKSYEMGVLFLPSQMKGAEEVTRFSVDPDGPLKKLQLAYSIPKNVADEIGIPNELLPIPFKVPPTPFDSEAGDEPWCVGIPRPGLDSHSRTWASVFGLTP